MKHPIPDVPINVQHSNPYSEPSRSLFVLRSPIGTLQYARVHAASWASKGPAASIGHLQFQLMGYATVPTTPAQFAAGTLLTAPDGSKWFDCLTRGLVVKPIMAEYWATTIYFAHYINEGAGKLTPEEIADAVAVSKGFADTVGRPQRITDVDFTTAFNAVAGQAMSRTNMLLAVDYTTNTGRDSITISDFPTVDFDPMQLAMHAVRNLRE